jgi:hypothetical protein
MGPEGRENGMKKMIEFDDVGEDRDGNQIHLKVTRGETGHYHLTLFLSGPDGREEQPVSFGLTHEQVQAIAKLAEGS